MSGKILIVDAATTRRIVLKVKLAEARYETMQAASGGEALSLAAGDAPALVIAAEALPDMAGHELCLRLRRMPGLANLPVLLISEHDIAQQRLVALKAGVSDVLNRPVDGPELLSRIRMELRRAAIDAGLEDTSFGLHEPSAVFRPPSRIAFIAQRRDVALQWKSALARLLPGDSLLVLSREDALIRAGSPNCPDAFVLTPELSRANDGLGLIADLRARARNRDCVICAAPGNAEHAPFSAAAFDFGADDLLPPDIASASDTAEIACRLRRQIDRKILLDRHRSEVAESLRLAAFDPLTGLFNRRHALPQIARMAERTRRTGLPLSVMVLDLDRFKRINDTWGHGAGDTVLMAVARRLRAALPPEGLVARIGGEEFLIALPDTALLAAIDVAKHICQCISLPIASPTNSFPDLHVTVSIGLTVAFSDPQFPPVEALIERADQALMGSKSGGRNQVRVYGLSAA